MDRLLQEIRSTFSDVEEIRMGPLLNSCRYMMACIDEGLRMTPPTSTAPPREVLANGINIDGNVIPEGCVVGTPIYGLHHNPDVFDDPFVYRPSRWLPEENTEEVYKRYKSGYCVYSKGPRSCIGRNQAQLQMPLTLARILFLFDIRITAGTNEGEGNPNSRTWGRHRPEEYQVRDWFTAERKGPSVQLKLREL
jgi:cytochrome P450